jgi:hypothetical protein
VTLLTAPGHCGGTRRCDARCYDSRPATECDCICSGRNHGVGLRKALENVRTVFAPILGQALEIGKQASVRIQQMEFPA